MRIHYKIILVFLMLVITLKGAIAETCEPHQYSECLSQFGQSVYQDCRLQADCSLVCESKFCAVGQICKNGMCQAPGNDCIEKDYQKCQGTNVYTSCHINKDCSETCAGYGYCQINEKCMDGHCVVDDGGVSVPAFCSEDAQSVFENVVSTVDFFYCSQPVLNPATGKYRCLAGTECVFGCDVQFKGCVAAPNNWVDAGQMCFPAGTEICNKKDLTHGCFCTHSLTDGINYYCNVDDVVTCLDGCDGSTSKCNVPSTCLLNTKRCCDSEQNCLNPQPNVNSDLYQCTEQGWKLLQDCSDGLVCKSIAGSDYSCQGTDYYCVNDNWQCHVVNSATKPASSCYLTSTECLSNLPVFCYYNFKTQCIERKGSCLAIEDQEVCSDVTNCREACKAAWGDTFQQCLLDNKWMAERLGMDLNWYCQQKENAESLGKIVKIVLVVLGIMLLLIILGLFYAVMTILLNAVSIVKVFIKRFM